MPITVYLSSAAEASPGARVLIEGTNGVFLNAEFPRPGTLTTHRINSGSGTISEMMIRFEFGSDQLQLSMERLPDDSVLSLLSLPGRAFLGGVLHSRAEQGCIVRCRNGKEGLNCVVCEANGIVGRVCC
jgi:hypothetical protein